jgi:predicted nucleic-acid-binding protein
LSKLKDFVLNNTFKDEEEEIQFFKEIKPGIFSQLIYHVKINNIESKRPIGSIEIQQNYLLSELLKLTMYFNSHLEFYRYYRMKSTFLDDKLFVRGREDFHLHLDNMMIYVDPEFSTSQDYMVAKIMANDRLEVYLKTEIDALSIKANNPNWGQVGYLGSNSLQWTESKTALVELIYALQASSAINKGGVDIRELVALFEEVFNVRLTDVYRTYLEIKIRITPTKFLDSLIAGLVKKIEEDL